MLSLASQSIVTKIPAQMVPLKKKLENKREWAKRSVDAFETLGRRQCLDNLRFLENYKMLNGEFLMHQYMDENPTDWLSMLTKEFEVPATLRHFDIINKIINNLTEKLMEFPDVFRVEEFFEDDETNEYTRTLSNLMHQSVKAGINKEIQERLIAEGLDPNKQDFTSEEEAMQYQQELQQQAQAMTPEKIQEYMSRTWQSQGEIWGTHQMAVDRQTFRLHEVERKEFKDMLTSDRCFRHFYLTGTGYMQEIWNPLHTFFHISEDIEWAQDGDYVGRSYWSSKADIIERIGWLLKSNDVKKLEYVDSQYENDKVDLSGFPTKVYAPFEDYKSYVQITSATGYDPLNKLPVTGSQDLGILAGKTPFNNAAGLYRVTEVYWKSQRKIGKIVYIDPDTNQPVEETVDENFVVPEGWKQKKGDYFKGHDINTVYWTYTNEVWKGGKITFSMADEEAIYFGLEPCEFQFKGDFSPYGSKLPVCGRIFNNRNAQSMSFVDFTKPFQVGHNLCMNQLYQLVEKEIGKFVVWDNTFFNSMKDWGGESSWQKIALVAKELGHVFGDTSPQNTKGANPGNQLPKVIDLELTAQMMSRAKLAEFFEMKMMAQLGVSPQMMGDVNATDTATGVKAATTNAQLNVQKYYTDYFEYKQRCLTMGLEIAQYVQSTKRDVTIMYTKSDASREYIKMTGINLLQRQLYTFIVNSQELLRQMEYIRNWFLTNNTADVNSLDIVEVIRANSPSAMYDALKKSMTTKNQKEQQAMQLQQQQIQQQGEIAANKEAKAEVRDDKKNATAIQVATINTFKEHIDPADAGDTSDDSLEQNKLTSQNQNNAAKNDLQREGNRVKRDKLNQDRSLKSRELDLKEKQIKEKAKESKDKVRIAKVNKN